MALGSSKRAAAAGWTQFFSSVLSAADQANRRRCRRTLTLAGRVDFGSNDYLGLRSHPRVLACLANPVVHTHWGSGASPVLSGYSQEHARLECALAEFSRTESALVFSSGYACNVGTIACLAGADDLILSDQLNHASLIDGCRLSLANKVIYPHLDVGFVRNYLNEHRPRFEKVLLLSESIFSMDGDAAPLAELATLADEFECGLVVDEAHALGVYGASGSGLLEELGLQDRVLAKLGTLSKALGGIGGYVAGDQDLIEFLVNRCRSYLFSTASPSPSVSVTHVALELLSSMRDERSSLRNLSRELRSQLADFGLHVGHGDSPIVPIIVGSENNALRLSKQLWEAGIYVPSIRPPTVAPETSRVRISLGVQHTTADVSRLVDGLKQFAKLQE